MTEIDPMAVKLFSFHVFTKLEGAVTAGMIHLGDRLGLYQAMAALDQPLTIDELSSRLNLAPRWVQEWAHNQAAAKVIEFARDEDGRETFWLRPEARLVLADEENPAFGMGMFHRLPQTMAALERLPESFRTGMGHDYDSHGPEGAVGIERSFEPWSNAFQIPLVVPALDGVVPKLDGGARVADIGCGAGRAALRLAQRFPHSEVVGYDISRYALDRAETKLRESGVANARFVDPRREPLPDDGSLDLVTAFDCVHDMTHPAEVMRAIRRSLKPDGTWLLVDIKALDTFEENAAKNPMASLMYGISVMSCMSSALSAPGGAGLGTLGLPESKARAMAEDAGFTRFRRLDIEHSVNAFYEVRP
ncbi:MAG: methyltransferase domain-containing protein [Actinobacteria bacterium]|nr:methyltransferase domain-containing protein [Actinomycetota bacterium]